MCAAVFQAEHVFILVERWGGVLGFVEKPGGLLVLAEWLCGLAACV